MTWVVEEPLYIVVLGILTMAVLGFAWMQTRLRGFLYGFVGVAVVTMLLLLVENWVKTETEVIQDTLYEMAADVESNDADAVLRHLSSQVGPATRKRAEAEMQTYRFDGVRVRQITRLEVGKGGSPPEAQVSCLVRAEGSRRATGDTGYVNVDVDLTLVKENGRWCIKDYSYQLPFGRINR